MNTCSNCGKLNTPETNFCRFCGTKFHIGVQPMPANPYDHAAPPRPYAWKTDEFQTQNEARKTVPTGLDQTIPFNPNIQNNLNNQNYRPAPLATYAQPRQIAQSFRCPHCMSTYMPRIERRISTGGWITFAALLVFFFPLFWIGLLIKEDVMICQTCNTKVGS